MSCIVARTCTEVADDGRDREAGSRPLDAFRDEPACVLLGDPGSGKTTAFERECAACGDAGLFIPARDFIALDPKSHPQWRGKTLFIDGLDEVRVGASDARAPLDAIRGRLDELGRPRFRLSCRAADWLGANDRRKLGVVAPGGRVTVLRLDPLTDSDAAEILESDSRVGDSQRFVQEARDRGIEGFLANPQSLDLLADVVGGDQGTPNRGEPESGGPWPASRLELFERACRRMAREHNEEHVAATGSPAGAPAPIRGSLQGEVLDAAGRLCAIQLITGVAGFALVAREEPCDPPALERCAELWGSADPSQRGGASPSALLRAAVATKLFRAAFPGRFAPVHRHVAEFLGARYLARLIRGSGPDRGLPAGRVLALMGGGDGVVATHLRGLSAWLAAQSPEARRELVERDPIGVSLYGDVGGFSPREKRELLEALERQTARLFSASWTVTALGSFVAAPMTPVFEELLAGARPSAQPSFTCFVLSLLTHGSPLPDLAPTLLGMVRDDTLRSDVKGAALDAFVRNRPHGQEKARELKALLADIRAGRVGDPDDDLVGILLNALYPDELSPADIWDHLSVRTGPIRLGPPYRFWRTLAEHCPASHVAEHLDVLAARPEAVSRMLQSLVLRELPVDLLARGLEAQGERIETKRLYDWLGVASESQGHVGFEAGDASQRIRAWLARRPQIQKAVVAEGMERAEAEPGRSGLLASSVWSRLLGSAFPPDFGLWCLRQAVAAPDRRVARFYLARAWQALSAREGDDGLSMEVLLDHTRDDPTLAEMLAELRRPDDADLALQEAMRTARRRREEAQREQEEWIEHVREHEEALRANRGSLPLLDQLGMAYFGFLAEAEGDDPLTRLQGLFLGDDRLVEAALIALRDALSRNDLPDVDEIIGLQEKNRRHLLALPFRAGLAELDRTGRDVSISLDERRLRIGLAFHYGGPLGEEPAWYRRLLAVEAEVVADVLTRCATSALRAGQHPVHGLHELARSGDHARVARVASLRILRSFPVRCSARQLPDLNDLLWAALLHADSESLSTLIARKLSRTSMNVAQRARWLAAGLVLSPALHAERVAAFARRSERRAREVAAFLGDSRDAPVWIDRLGAMALEALIRLMGASFGPCVLSSSEMARATPAREASEHVGRMIDRLAESPTDDARTALEALASDDSLHRWREALVRARDRQQVLRRDAAFRPPEIEQVCRALNDGPPANASDLAALVRDRLATIGIDIRRGNDNGWRRYWNEGEHRRPVTPKHENSCRDALLGDLRPRLPYEVDAQPEGRYANDRRADIRVSSRDFHVPVEIKKNDHPELWSAMRRQLIARYTIDPATGGCGIYLVLWFGDGASRGTPPPPSGPRPDGPDALRVRLEEDLTPDEALRISVVVVDVSAPGRDGADQPRTGSAEFRSLPRIEDRSDERPPPVAPKSSTPLSDGV